jgi:hypothetical protein
MSAESTTFGPDTACACGHPRALHGVTECGAAACQCQIYRPDTFQGSFVSPRKWDPPTRIGSIPKLP